MDLVRQLLKEKPEEFAHPTFFELLFLMGIYIFDKTHMEYVVLETGLGGRFDATNVIEKPLVSVITSISLEHTEYLGDTHAKIAGEKAGIIKEGCRSSMTEPGRMWKKPFLRRLPRCMRRPMPSVRTCIKF